ncbi:hypothetical protein OIE67_52415 [Nonomuraea fuscirosea]|uniref:hypothetical protein n=1 Tax=Nonomuraea fuscirosea TaxID=1291556 RepID=UPI002DDC82CB|nr:hypothetical protein [Nonomuraea fuscirosea]WSA52529.1 hypothetical protein OIE67_52415 [Nonomuraea fuscirosea]
MTQPSDLPQKPFDDEYSGIHPSWMDQFEKALSRAGELLRRNEPLVRRAMERVELDVSGLSAMREVEGWIRSKSPELRRRNDAIQAMNDTWGPQSNGLIPFDEELHKKVSYDADAYAAAAHLNRAADGEKVDDKTLAQLEKHAGDTGFALKLMNAMGPERVRRLLAKVNGQDDKQSERLQAALGKALGSASSQLSTQWRRDLTSKLTRGTQAGIAAALKHGSYNTSFLVEVAKALDTFERGPMAHHVVGRHPMADVMEALKGNPEAAQEFFASGDRLKFYTTVLSLKDGGKAVGQALEAATMKLRDRAGSPEQPFAGYRSADLAAKLMELQYEQVKAGKPQETFVAPISIGRILASYIPDVNRAAMGGIEQPGVYTQDHPGVPGQEPWGAKFNRQHLIKVMQHTFEKDEKALGVVTAAQAAWSGKLYDFGAAELAAKHGKDAMITATQEVAAGFGLIAYSGGIAKITEGRELDEAQKRNMKMFMAVINTGLSFPQAGAWPITASVVGSWGSVIEDSVQGTAEKNAVESANFTAEYTREFAGQLAAQAMFNHGLFGSPDPPAKSHPWASLTDVRPGDDPRKSPNNFLKDDGKTLMTLEEMMKSNQNPYDAYKAWLRRPNDNPWVGLGMQQTIDQAYANGFPKF